MYIEYKYDMYTLNYFIQGLGCTVQGLGWKKAKGFYACGKQAKS